MPIYEYKCENGHKFEKIESLNSPKITECPYCKSKAQRIFSASELPRNKGIWIFDRKTKRDILHDR